MLFGSGQFRSGLFPLGQVFDRGEQDRLAVDLKAVQHDFAGKLYPVIPAPVHPFEGDILTQAGALQVIARGGGGRRAVRLVCGRPFGPQRAGQFFPRRAAEEPPRGRIGVNKAAVVVHQEQGVPPGFKKGAEFALRALQFQLGLLALGHIAGHANDLGQRSVRMQQRISHHFGPENRPVFAVVSQLVAEVFRCAPGREVGVQLFPPCGGLGEGFRRMDLVEGLGHGFLRGETAHNFDRRAHVGNCSIRLHRPNGVARILGEETMPLLAQAQGFLPLSQFGDVLQSDDHAPSDHAGPGKHVVDGAVLGGDTDLERGGNPAIGGGVLGGGGALRHDLAAIIGVRIQTVLEFLHRGCLAGLVAQGFQPATVEKQTTRAEISPLAGHVRLDKRHGKRQVGQGVLQFRLAGTEVGFGGFAVGDFRGEADEHRGAVGLPDRDFLSLEDAHRSVRVEDALLAAERERGGEGLLVESHDVGRRLGRKQFGIGMTEDLLQRILHHLADFGIRVDVASVGIFHEDVRVDMVEYYAKRAVLMSGCQTREMGGMFAGRGG